MTESRPNPWLTLLVASLGTFMLLLDITVVNVALPDIREDLGASFSDLQWVVDAYALTLASVLLMAGSLADRVGRRRVFNVGLALFVTASVACGLARDPLALELARAAQGIGGAAMFATSLALIASAFEGPSRGTAFGVWGASTGLGVAIGPLIGGLLVAGPGWEWIFFINVPIGVAVLAVSLRFVAESHMPHARPVDVPGTLLFTAALAALVLALIEGGHESFSKSYVIALFVAAAVLLAVFVVAQLREREPMLPPALFRIPTFIGALVAAFSLSAGMFSLFLLISIYMQSVLGYDALETGVRFLPITLATLVVAPAAGRLSERLPVRALMSGGLGLVAVGLLLMSRVTAGDAWTVLLPGFLVAGVGIGLINPPLASTAIGVVHPRDVGMGSGINTTFRQVGIATGIAAMGAIFQSRIDSILGSAIAERPVPGIGTAEDAVSNGAIGALPPDLRATGTEAFTSAMGDVMQIGAAITAVAAVLTLALVRRRDFWAVREGTAQAAPASPAEPAPAAN
jgi:EmrB/QacA subfamily drug resistance transporter